jgi:exopolysaccharide production regulatory protein
MSLPRFLFGMLGVLVVFAVATYAATQSIWTTFIQTLLCAVLIQLGYFAAVLFMVWRSADSKQGEKRGHVNGAQSQNPADEAAGSKVQPLPGAQRPRHF